jgi:hypothetical protein
MRKLVLVVARSTIPVPLSFAVTWQPFRFRDDSNRRRITRQSRVRSRRFERRRGYRRDLDQQRLGGAYVDVRHERLELRYRLARRPFFVYLPDGRYVFVSLHDSSGHGRNGGRSVIERDTYEGSDSAAFTSAAVAGMSRTNHSRDLL